ncbi:MAG: AraC family transcriptional regulator [Lactobacillus sp.]|jgi:AraC-like DNA-binding protein|nr:AraC family transcriptional regulator [Lactobacillus sp.]
MPYKMEGPHSHNRYEIYYLSKLEGTAHINIMGKDYPLTQDSLVLIDSFLPHQTDFSGASAHERYLIEVAPEHFSKEASQLIDFPIDLFFKNFYGVYALDPKTAITIKHLFISINREFILNESQFENMIILKQLEIFVLLERFVEQESDYLGTADQQRIIIPVVKFIVEHFQEEISLSSLANTFFVDKSYLARTFKCCTGKTVHRFINQRRLDMAERYLAIHTEYSIEEIAYLCGFHSLSYFDKLFRSIVNISPKQFRQRYHTQSH